MSCMIRKNFFPKLLTIEFSLDYKKLATLAAKAHAGK